MPKIFIKDGAINFYKYKITGKDGLSRDVVLYAKDDTEKDALVAKLTTAAAVDVSPSAAEQTRAIEWQQTNINDNSKTYDVAHAETFITATSGKPDGDNIVTATEFRVYSKTNPSSKLTIDYNEAEGSIDFNIN